MKYLNSLLLFCLCYAMTVSVYASNYKLEKHANWNDNENIEPIGSQYYSDLWGYADENGREYAIIGSVEGTHFIDVTDPGNPEQVQFVPGRNTEATHRDFHTYKHYAYAVADNAPGSSLQIFDLQYLPDSVEVVYDEDSLVVQSHNSFIDNDRLYLALHNDGSSTHAMSVFSLDNPEVPEYISTLTAPVSGGDPLFSEVHDVHVRNDSAYCFNGFGGMFIYDYTDPSSPQLQSGLQNYPARGYNHSGWLNDEGDILVFTDEVPFGLPLKLYDVSDWKEPQLLDIFGDRYEEGATPHNPFIKDSLIYVSYYQNGVVVFDKSDPENVRKVASYNTFPDNNGPLCEANYQGFHGAWGVYPFLPSGTIIAADTRHGLFVLTLEEDPDARAVTLTEPANGTKTDPEETIFSWDEIAEARSYQVQISESESFSSLTANFFVDPDNKSKTVNDGHLSQGTTYYWRVKAFDDNCDGLWSEVRTFTTEGDPNFLSEADKSGKNVKVYPNPFNDVFTLELTGFSGPVSMKIYDLTGRIIKEKALEADRSKNSLDLSSGAVIPAGIYVIHLNDDVDSIQKKIYKK